MQRKITRFLIENRRFTVFFTVLLIAAGLYTYHIMPKQENPDVAAPVAIIKTICPGASAEDVQQLVTKPILEKAAEVPGYDFTRSDSKNSASIVILQLDTEADTEKAWRDLRQKMDDVQADLPAECSKIDIDTNLAETAGIIIAISGDNYSYEQLGDMAEIYKRELGQIAGVERLEISGQVEKQVTVKADTGLLNQNKLSLADLTSALAAQNVDIPSGSIETASGKINVEAPGIFSSFLDIGNTIVGASSETGAVVRLRDLAEVNWESSDDSVIIKHNGAKAVLLAAYFESDRNVVLVGEDVRTCLDSLKTQMPEDLLIDEVLYQPTDIDNSISEFMTHLLIGMVLVLAVVLLGMGLRNAVVASTAIPLSILIAFIVMHLAGIKVEKISITALIIALGMLVDDAIVIVDAIQVQIDQGLNKLEACIEGSHQAAVPVLTSTLTSAVAFAPVLMIPGSGGQYTRSIPLVVIISLTASYLVAMLVTPVISYILFDDSHHEKDEGGRARRFFNRMLALGMAHKVRTVIIAIAVLALSLGMLKFLDMRLFPHADKDFFYINIFAERSADQGATEDLVAQVETLLGQQPEITACTSSVGESLPKFFISLMKEMPSKDYAQIMVRADLEKGGRFENNEELALYLQQQINSSISGGRINVKLLEEAYPYQAITVRVNGNNIERIREVAAAVKSELNSIPGTINVADNDDKAVYEYSVDLNQDRASAHGISKYDIQKQISIALRGAKSCVYRKSGNQYDVIVKSDIQSKEELENLAIKSSVTGKKTPLKQIAEVKIKSIRPTVKEYRGELSLAVSSDVEPSSVPVNVENELKDRLAAMDTSDVEIVFDGEGNQIQRNFSNLGAASLFILIIIYFILMLQFQSFIQPLIIFVTIPLSIIGVIWGLFIFQQPISFTAALGMAALMGLVVKNSILLLDYIKHARRNGEDIDEACKQAVNRRCRPVLLTAITAIIGLTPLAVSGSNLFMPLAIAIMSGLSMATFLTMVVIPVVYSLVEGFRERHIKGSEGRHAG